MACREGRLKDVKALLDAGVDIPSTDGDGCTPLIMASRNDNVGVFCKFVLEPALYD
jgi:ankyrin repeat protein